MGEKICKEEEMEEDEMASSRFDGSAFGPSIDHFPIPLEMKEDIIEAGEKIEKDEEKGKNTKYVAQNLKESTQLAVNSFVSPYPVCTVSFGNSSIESSLNAELENDRKPSRTISEPLISNGFLGDLDGDGGPLAKRVRDELEKRRDQLDEDDLIFRKLHDKTNPKCIMCEVYPTTVHGYCKHLYKYHSKSTLKGNGIYLLCSCGIEAVSDWSSRKHNGDCDGRQFTLLKLEANNHSTPNIHSTPQCVLCEAHPSTTYGYSEHLMNQHKTTLNANGVFLLCSCGIEARSVRTSRKHNGECDGRQFTLCKLEDKIHSTPKCVLCEAHPSTVCGYTQHLYRHNKSTLSMNGIFLLCSCGEEIRSSTDGANHVKKCDGRQFTLHKLDMN